MATANQTVVTVSAAAQHKVAERLTLLNDRGQGLLIRLYNIKKRIGDADGRPQFLGDKTMESSIKAIAKKFPAIDTKSIAVQPLAPIKEEVSRQLRLSYETFLDVMDFKSHADELLSRVDNCKLHFDIALSFSLTRLYLELIACYVSMIILLTQIEDRKLVISLYAFAQELLQQPEKSFPRLAQFFIDYDEPVRKLAEEFVPHTRCVGLALASLKETHTRRLMKAEDWRATNALSILADPLKLGDPIVTATTGCEYLSCDAMDRWIILGYLVCQSLLSEEQNIALWKQAMNNSFTLVLCRDEVLPVHNYIAETLQTIKAAGLAKRISEVKDWYSQTAASVLHHRERRKYLRITLRELVLMLEDEPGLVGPKALLVLSGLSYASDEVKWLIRHAEFAPLKKGALKINAEDLVDRLIAELLYYIDNLRNVMTKHSSVVRRYYMTYMADYDAYELSDILAKCTFSAAESSILNSYVTDMSQLNADDSAQCATLDFRGLRLDLVRLQSYMSMERSQNPLKDKPALAALLDNVAFHSKMIDALDETLTESSDLSVYAFYTPLIESQFKQCVEYPPQHRYIIMFPSVTAQFTNACHELCPEEVDVIGKMADQFAAYFLKSLCDEVTQLFFRKICEQLCELDEKLLPKRAVNAMIQLFRRKKKGKKTVAINELTSVTPQASDSVTTLDEVRPGAESIRKNRELFNEFDKAHFCFVELCTAINLKPYIPVYQRGFVPREIFSKMLELNCNMALARLLRSTVESHSQMIRPSELLLSIKTIIAGVRTAESYVQIDTTAIIQSALYQQSRLKDESGESTITTHLIDFYLDLLQQAIYSPIIFSPLHRSFVTVTSEMLSILHSAGLGKSSLLRHSTVQSLSEIGSGSAHESTPTSFASLSAENYTSYAELRALVEIIGPIGVQNVQYQVAVRIMDHLDKIKKVVLMNLDILRDCRKNAAKPDRLRESSQKLQAVETVLQRMTIIGLLLNFRRALMNALDDMLDRNMPFLHESIRNFALTVDPNAAFCRELIASAGHGKGVDPFLQKGLADLRTSSAEDDHEISCLLLVCVAVCLPRLAVCEGSIFLPQFESHLNNIHCLAVSINTIAQEMFHFHSKNDTLKRLTEFVSLSSVCLLRLGQDFEESLGKNIDSVYILLDLIVRESDYLTSSVLEKFFPYVLLRNAYNSVYKVANIDFTVKASKNA